MMMTIHGLPYSQTSKCSLSLLYSRLMLKGKIAMHHTHAKAFMAKTCSMNCSHQLSGYNMTYIYTYHIVIVSTWSHNKLYYSMQCSEPFCDNL